MANQESGIFDQAERNQRALSKAGNADTPEARAIEELLALGRDLTREKAETAERIQLLHSKLEAAEDRADEAEAQVKKLRAAGERAAEAQAKKLQAAEERAERVEAEVKKLRAAGERTAEAEAKKAQAAEERAAAAEARAKQAAGEAEAERRRRSETDERLVSETVAMREKLEALRTQTDERIGWLKEQTGLTTEAAKSNGSAGRSEQRQAARQPEGGRGIAESEDNPKTRGLLRLNEASLEELRYLGMTMTQAKRVIKFREDRPFTAIDDLNLIPGFSLDFLKAVEGRVAP